MDDRLVESDGLRDGFSLIEALAAVALLALAALPLYDMAASLLRSADRLALISAQIDTAGDADALSRMPAAERPGPQAAPPQPRSFQEEARYAGGQYGFRLVEIELRAVPEEGIDGNERVIVEIVYRQRYDSLDELLDDSF